MEGREWINGFVLLLLPEICCPALVASMEGSLGWAVSHIPLPLPPRAGSCVLPASSNLQPRPQPHACGERVFPHCAYPLLLHKHGAIWSPALCATADSHSAAQLDQWPHHKEFQHQNWISKPEKTQIPSHDLVIPDGELS